MSCEHVKLNGVSAIVCNSRRRSRCSVRAHPQAPWTRCEQWAEKLCDFPMPGGKTCDKPLCRWHAKNVGPDRDYCPEHALAGQVELPL